jgi:hypothetical protein
MRWFKHISLSQNDETLCELMDKFGAEGYGVWWLILEKIAQLMDETERTFGRFSLKVWANSAKVSVKKFQSITTFLEKKQTFLLKLEDGYLTIDCPKLLKYRDEWSEKKSRESKKLGSKSGATPEKLPLDRDRETQAQTEKKEMYKEKERDAPASEHSLDANDSAPDEVGENLKKQKQPPCPYDDIIALYHKLCPTNTHMRERTKARDDHLRARWREYPDLLWWEQFFEIVAESKFLTGRVSTRDRKPFLASLPWLVMPENFAKVLDGNYD